MGGKVLRCLLEIHACRDLRGKAPGLFPQAMVKDQRDTCPNGADLQTQGCNSFPGQMEKLRPSRTT